MATKINDPMTAGIYDRILNCVLAITNADKGDTKKVSEIIEDTAIDIRDMFMRLRKEGLI